MFNNEVTKRFSWVGLIKPWLEMTIFILKCRHKDVFYGAHNRVHSGSWLPAEQIVSSQQVDCHLLLTLGIDIITPQFCDSCLFAGGEMSHLERTGYCLPERAFALFLWSTLSSAFQVFCRLCCCCLGTERYLSADVCFEERSLSKEKMQQNGSAKKTWCWQFDRTVGIQPTLASKITWFMQSR